MQNKKQKRDLTHFRDKNFADILNLAGDGQRRTPNFSKFGGVYSGKVTPDPIPNSEVKLAHGESSTEVARR